jgi:hypothetical protein
MNVGNNAAANLMRQDKVVYLNRNFLLASGILSILHPCEPLRRVPLGPQMH